MLNSGRIKTTGFLTANERHLGTELSTSGNNPLTWWVQVSAMLCLHYCLLHRLIRALRAARNLSISVGTHCDNAGHLGAFH